MESPIFTKAGKRKFIRDLCNAVRDEAVSKVGRMPSTWDGRELREYLADKFEASRMPVSSASRRKAYRDAVAVENL